MKVLVTGGAGFIGANFILYWLKKHPNDQIVNIDKLTYAGNLENLKSIESNPNYSFVKADIIDQAQIEPYAQKCDLVVHFAAESHVDRSILSPKEFIDTNVVGTHTLLELARKYKIRFHHISTDEVFGSLKLNTLDKFDELTPYDPSSPYSASKAASDHLVRAYHRTYGLDMTISNCSNNFGPYQFPEKFIPLAITNLIEDKKVPIYATGNQVRDWLYVEDHCRAIDLIIHKGKTGQTYLIGGTTEDITNLTVAKKIINYLGKNDSYLEFISDRPGHDVRYSIDWSKANKELGYKPQHSFEKYLEFTIDWYLKHPDWWKSVKSGEYQKYYQKQYQNR